MNERMNESISALVDGEADELEIRRLLNQAQTSPECYDTWGRYQLIGAVMRQEPVAVLDLAKGIRQALDGEPMDEISLSQPHKSASNWRWLTASGAVAASVMIAVLVGVQWQQQSSQTATVAAVESVSAPAVAPAMAVSQVALAEPTEQERQQLEAAQRKLQEYVLQHNEQAVGGSTPTLLPYMQTVKFNQGVEAR